LKRALICAASLLAGCVTGLPQAAGGGQIVDEPAPLRLPLLSPPAKTSVTVNGRKIAIRYSAPSMRKRLIFGGLEPYHKVWRAGANDATALETAADLQIEGLKVPKGNYTLFVWLDPKQWLLIINKQTGQSGLEYHQERDLGRVPMEMSQSPKPIETYKMTLTRVSGNEGRLILAWENTIAAVRFTVSGGQ
jgi:Protein of unknown function (DUF2911)